jgi:hypothetical protein
VLKKGDKRPIQKLYADKLDRREITPQEFFDAWDKDMEENAPASTTGCMSI